MRSGETTFYNRSSKGMAQKIQQGKYLKYGGPAGPEELPESKMSNMVQTSRNGSKKTIFSDRFEDNEITRNKETLTAHIQNIEKNCAMDVGPLPMTH